MRRQAGVHAFVALALTDPNLAPAHGTSGPPPSAGSSPLQQRQMPRCFRQDVLEQYRVVAEGDRACTIAAHASDKRGKRFRLTGDDRIDSGLQARIDKRAGITADIGPARNQSQRAIASRA